MQTPVYFYSIRAGYNKLMETHWKKRDELGMKNMLDPTRIEIAMGVICTLCLIGNIYYKWHDMTLIFMLNPCHIVCVSQKFLPLLETISNCTF